MTVEVDDDAGSAAAETDDEAVVEVVTAVDFRILGFTFATGEETFEMTFSKVNFLMRR